MEPQPDIRATILKEAAMRGPEKSTCPSEIARKLISTPLAGTDGNH